MSLLLILSAALALAEAPQEAAKPAEAEKPKLVCRKEVETGTRFSRRICRTAEEWQAEAEASKKTLEGIRNRPNTPTR
jgi:hypothetical protein